MNKQLEQVRLNCGESVAIHVYGIGSLAIELSQGGRCFVRGPLLSPSRTVMEFANVRGLFDSTERERQLIMNEAPAPAQEKTST